MLLNLAGDDAQFARSSCSISGGILIRQSPKICPPPQRRFHLGPNNALEGLPSSLSKTQYAIKSAQQNLEQAKAELNKPFPFEEELAAKSARLGELNAMLDMDKPENEIVDGERDEEDSTLTPEQNLDR